MSFERFRPTSHFIPPHSWSNDPCGAVYVPETKEYIICYQWNPGTSEGGNSAWGMARSKNLVTWEDCSPAIRTGDSYDRLGVFSGSIVSRLIDKRRVLFLFYTSVSAMPIHWSKDYIPGCESQSVAFSTDFGSSWHRYESNPLMKNPPRGATTGWRDPFVSRWDAISELLGNDPSTEYMMISSGEKGRGPQLHLYQSQNLLDWEPVSTILSVEANSRVSPTSNLKFGMNFECGSFFSMGKRHYLIVGVEEDHSSTRHNGRYLLWLSGDLVLEKQKPRFVVKAHGLLDHGIGYAAHIFRDSEGRLLQLGWADEAAKKTVVTTQGWAGLLPHARELYEISQPVSRTIKSRHSWDINERSAMMTTLGIRPAPQVRSLRDHAQPCSLERFSSIRSKNFEFEASFARPSKNDVFTFNVRQCPNSTEVTRVIFDLPNDRITVDRSQSSLESLGETSNDVGHFELLAHEDLHVWVFVDNSIVEVYANDRFALTSRIYPSLETSRGASYDFQGFDEQRVTFSCWEGLKNAWPRRKGEDSPVMMVPEVMDQKSGLSLAETVVPTEVYA